MGLKEVGVQLAKDGCIIGKHGNDRERSSVPSIYAIGDVLQVFFYLCYWRCTPGIFLSMLLEMNSRYFSICAIGDVIKVFFYLCDWRCTPGIFLSMLFEIYSRYFCIYAIGDVLEIFSI